MIHPILLFFLIWCLIKLIHIPAPSLEPEEVSYWSSEQINAVVESAQSFTSMHIDVNEDMDDIPIVSSNSRSKNKYRRVPHNTPHSSNLLSYKELEYIRELSLNRRNKQESESTVTTDTSEISKPDSTDRREALWQSQSESIAASQTLITEQDTLGNVSAETSLYRKT